MQTIKRFALAFTLIAALVSLQWARVSAFTQLTSTTLSAAVTSTSATTITVASATGIAANTTGLFVDWEYMSVSGVSGTTITVTRGANGTRAGLHANAATVTIGNPNAFTTVDPVGYCVIANILYQPVINVRNGNVWLCRSTVWQATNSANIVYNSYTRTP